MKPYETMKLIEAPDVADIQFEGRKSSVGQLPTRSGEYKSCTRSAKSRKESRRYLKRKDKARVKLEWQNELAQMHFEDWAEVQAMIEELFGYEEDYEW